MLGVSIENNFSVAQHVQRLVTASAQTVYALRVLRTRGLGDNALQHNGSDCSDTSDQRPVVDTGP